jgi:tRNA(Ile)-lysidine synthase
MLRAVLRAITTRGLIRRGDHVLAAVSGGADSVALVYVLHHLQRQLDIRLTVAHLNHGIRGREAEEDARFVSQLSWSIGAPCLLGAIDVPRFAERSGVSLEMAAREARYDFLVRTAKEVGAHAVATAHTADDQVETVLLKLARGAGLQGLAGIPWQSEWDGMRIVRPLRGIYRSQVEAFLRAHGLKWREDRTNRDPQHLRNRVRHEILPLMEKRLNPRMREAIARMAEIVAEENEWLNRHAREIMRRCRGAKSGGLRVRLLARHAPAIRRRVLRLWLVESGVEAEAIDFEIVEAVHRLILDYRGAQRVALPRGRIALRSYDELTVRESSPEWAPYWQEIKIPGETVVLQAGLRVAALIGKGIVRQTGRRPGDLPAEASLSLEAIGHSPLYVRSWQAGDRIRPLGMRGSRKLQDVFVDAKVPRDRRWRIPVFECRGEIVWVPGYRVAEGWDVKDAAGPSLHLHVGAW